MSGPLTRSAEVANTAEDNWRWTGGVERARLIRCSSHPASLGATREVHRNSDTPTLRRMLVTQFTAFDSLTSYKLNLGRN